MWECISVVWFCQDGSSATMRPWTGAVGTREMNEQFIRFRLFLWRPFTSLILGSLKVSILNLTPFKSQLNLYKYPHGQGRAVVEQGLYEVPKYHYFICVQRSWIEQFLFSPSQLTFSYSLYRSARIGTSLLPFISR